MSKHSAKPREASAKPPQKLTERQRQVGRELISDREVGEVGEVET